MIYQIEVLGRPGQKILLEIPGAPESEMIADKMIPRKMPVAGSKLYSHTTRVRDIGCSSFGVGTQK